jgi:hypothetical protein
MGKYVASQKHCGGNVGEAIIAGQLVLLTCSCYTVTDLRCNKWVFEDPQRNCLKVMMHALLRKRVLKIHLFLVFTNDSLFSLSTETYVSALLIWTTDATFFLKFAMLSLF